MVACAFGVPAVDGRPRPYTCRAKRSSTRPRLWGPVDGLEGERSPGHLVTWWSMDSMDSMVSMPKNTVVNYGLQVIHSSFPDDFVGDHDEMMISIDFWTMF